MKKLRILALMHDYMVPPLDVSGEDLATVEWKTEYDVTSTLADIGHDVNVLGVKDDLGVIRQVVDDFKPHIAFNLMGGVSRGRRIRHERRELPRASAPAVYGLQSAWHGAVT